MKARTAMRATMVRRMYRKRRSLAVPSLVDWKAFLEIAEGEAAVDPALAWAGRRRRVGVFECGLGEREEEVVEQVA